jgi:hypothetical protein
MPQIVEEHESFEDSSNLSNCTFHHLVQGEIMPLKRTRQAILLLRAKTDFMQRFEFGNQNVTMEAQSPGINSMKAFGRN